ncbi:uncharacterized protein [Eleutherodactylus coqui]|uniref:uncharacterized protein n=1 Tax=Eleutherodactylus coqui TaxID=57060 RepID=UPI0034622938
MDPSQRAPPGGQASLFAGLADGAPGASSPFMFSEADATKILSEVSVDTSFLCTPSAAVLQKQFESERKHMISYNLHLATLHEYYQARRIPRGLRSSMRPTLLADNSSFCAKFEGILNKCSFDLMLLNIEYLCSEVKRSREIIGDIESQLKQQMGETDWLPYSTKMDALLRKYQEDIESTKRMKWYRDAEDYKNNKVYKWQYSRGHFSSNPNPRRNQRRGRMGGQKRKGEFGFTSVGSDSTDDSSRPVTERNPNTARFLGHRPPSKSRINLHNRVESGEEGASTTERGKETMQTRATTRRLP